MNNIEIRNFKVFDETFSVDLGGKSMLVYGENGAGKSSMYEAIELYYFHDLLLRQNLRRGAPSREMEIDRFHQRYVHKTRRESGESIEVKIDGLDFRAAHAGHPSDAMPECAMLSYDMFGVSADTLRFGDLASRLHASHYPGHLDNIDLDYVQDCVKEVNDVLEKKFRDTIRVGIDDTQWTLYLANGDLRASEALHGTFNEARINLVTLLLYLQIIRREYAAPDVRPVLVLDDIVTSYDACNRTFLVDYLLSDFKDFQLIILTHNVGFNNLFERVLSNRNLTKDWKLVNMYIWNGVPCMYEYSDYTDILQFRASADAPAVIHPSLAQELRKRFEAVINELGKALQIGVSERPNYYIERLSNASGPIYIKTSQGKRNKFRCLTADNLVKDITAILCEDGCDDSQKVAAILREIDSYSTNEALTHIAELVRQFNFHEKLYIHRLSHGCYSLSNLSEKEFQAAVAILMELKSNVDIMKKDIGEM